jgi:hypothetical protein
MKSKSRKETINTKKSGDQQGRKYSPEIKKTAHQRARSSPAKFQLEPVMHLIGHEQSF